MIAPIQSVTSASPNQISSASEIPPFIEKIPFSDTAPPLTGRAVERPDSVPYLESLWFFRRRIVVPSVRLAERKLIENRLAAEFLRRIEEDFSKLHESSFFKRYFRLKGLMNEEGGLIMSATPLETKQKIMELFRLFPVLSELTEEEIEGEAKKSTDYRPYHPLLWSESILKIKYRKCLDIFNNMTRNRRINHPAILNLVEIFTSKTATTEEKLQRINVILKETRKELRFPLMKKWSSLSFEQTNPLPGAFLLGPLIELDIGLELDLSGRGSFLESWERKKDLEFIYLSVITDPIFESGYPVKTSLIYTDLEEGRFNSIYKLASKISLRDRKLAFKEKIRGLYRDFFREEPPNIPDFPIFCQFKKAFKQSYLSLRSQLEEPLDFLIADDAYLSFNIELLRSIKKG